MRYDPVWLFAIAPLDVSRNSRRYEMDFFGFIIIAN